MVKQRLAGIAGSSLLLPWSSIALDPEFQLLSRTERDHAACGDRNLLAGLGIAPGPLVLVAQVEVAEPRQLHLLPPFQRLAQHLEEGVHAFLGLALVEPAVEEQALGHFRFSERHLSLSTLPRNRVPEAPGLPLRSGPRPRPKASGNRPAKQPHSDTLSIFCQARTVKTVENHDIRQ